ncbi:alpha/beta hydrolase [Amycolatopsis sp. NPDC047767]|uniref:alpha/beta hydrolase n=1 Tax=Amycolatopsis sp. NPDC047767 TaxID=3156765 RepID=UPI003455D430
MVSLADVRAWSPAALEDIFSLLQARTQTLINDGDDFAKTLPVVGWSGDAADNAAAQHRALTRGLDTVAAGAAALGKTIAQAADAITGVQSALTNAEELAHKYGYQITDAGAVADAFAGQQVPPDLNPQDRARTHTQLVDDVAQILRTADDIDTDLASVLDRAAAGQFGTGDESTVAAAAADGVKDPGLTLPEPPPHATPAENAAWWATLSAAGQAILLRDHPDWLGNRDGLPAAVRSQANMARLPAERAALEQQRTAAQAMIEQAKAVYDPSGGIMKAALGQLQQANDKLASLDAIATTMGQGGRQLLLLDTTHPRVEAAIAVGDVDKARNVAVFTPGFTTTVDGSLGKYDQNMNDLKGMANDITDRHGGGPTATVTWIGYQAPQWDGVADPSQSVASPELAKAGGDSLAKFYNGIGAGHDASNTPLHLTALGHSYGSTTTGFALGHDTPVDDAVLFGSPGQGSDHLNVPRGHLFNEHDAGDDLVPNIHGTLGPSPYYSPDAMSQYHQMSTDASATELGQLNATSGHSGYLDGKSTSLYNMAAITTGHPDLAQYKGTVIAGAPR